MKNNFEMLNKLCNEVEITLENIKNETNKMKNEMRKIYGNRENVLINVLNDIYDQISFIELLGNERNYFIINEIGDIQINDVLSKKYGFIIRGKNNFAFTVGHSTYNFGSYEQCYKSILTSLDEHMINKIYDKAYDKIMNILKNKVEIANKNYNAIYKDLTELQKMTKIEI